MSTDVKKPAKGNNVAEKQQKKPAKKPQSQQQKIDGVMRRKCSKSEKFRQLNDLGLSAADIQKVFKNKNEKEPHYSHVYGVLRSKWAKEKAKKNK